ncbi:MAG TPA: hypothetical protein ENF27_03570 [Chloroflexi bacterium]|nr:hypothetical protein [Chloroflexota bacterium]
MKIYLRIPAIILVLLVCCTLVSSVQAGATADQIINALKTNPCVSTTQNSGGTFSYPRITCNSYKGASSYINLPIPIWVTDPEYHFVGESFYLGFEPYLGSADFSFPLNSLTWNEKVRINNFRVELKSIAYQPNTTLDFNGVLAHDASMDTTMTIMRKPSDTPEPSLRSVDGWPTQYYEGNNIDTLMMSLFARKSSYHAENPTTYQGEPAYRLQVTSYYRIDARVSWSSHQYWEEVYNTVCVPGPSGSGIYNCTLNDGTPGHLITVDNSHWDPPQGGHTGEWLTIGIYSTKLVRWPDNRNHDHVPILVFQSQPLLQKP